MKTNAKVLSTMCLGLMAATAAHGQQQPGVRAPSGTGTTSTAQAAAKVATTGTPTTTAMVGAPPAAATVAKPSVAGASNSAATAPPNPGKRGNGQIPPP